MKQQICALYLASKDVRTPNSAKFLVIIVVGYALSPIDLIPDFIPVLGFLDDLVLLPLGIHYAIKLMPSDLWEEFQFRANQHYHMQLPVNSIATTIIISIWVASIATLSYFYWWPNNG